MSDAYSILIADAEDAARARLRELLDELKPEFPNQVVGEAKAGQAALSQISALHPQAVLLDAQLPDMSGIELARQVSAGAQTPPGTTPPALIFVAGTRQYALDAFEVDALDYLLKPVEASRLLSALRRLPTTPPASALPAPPSLMQLSASLQHAPTVESHLPGTAQQAQAREEPAEAGPLPAPRAEPRRQFCVHERGRVLLVPVDQVIYLKAELKYVTVRTRQREYLIEDSLTAIEAEFGDRFVRVHRNALVARSSIAGFERVTPGADARGVDPYWQVVLRDVPERLQVSRRQWSHVRHLIG